MRLADRFVDFFDRHLKGWERRIRRNARRRDPGYDPFLDYHD